MSWNREGLSIIERMIRDEERMYRRVTGSHAVDPLARYLGPTVSRIADDAIRMQQLREQVLGTARPYLDELERSYRDPAAYGLENVSRTSLLTEHESALIGGTRRPLDALEVAAAIERAALGSAAWRTPLESLEREIQSATALVDTWQREIAAAGWPGPTDSALSSTADTIRELERYWASIEAVLDEDMPPAPRLAHLAARLETLAEKLLHTGFELIGRIAGVLTIAGFVHSSSGPPLEERVEAAVRKAIEPIEQQLALLARTRDRLEASGVVTRYVVTTSVHLRTGPAVTHDRVDLLAAGERLYATE
ncbi:MAG: hypothetical protein ACPG1A_08570, partial [Halioglobus sp.]